MTVIKNEGEGCANWYQIIHFRVNYHQSKFEKKKRKKKLQMSKIHANINFFEQMPQITLSWMMKVITPMLMERKVCYNLQT